MNGHLAMYRMFKSTRRLRRPLVCWLVSLSVSRIAQKLQRKFSEVIGVIGLGTKKPEALLL